MTLANMTQEETYRHNLEACKHIANTLELVAYGQMYRCPECGELVDIEEHEEDAELYEAIEFGLECKCPNCHEPAEFELVSVYDWLDDALDIKYTVTADLDYSSGRVLVAYGGPNIYVDTAKERVELYWWSDRADYGISTIACNELDEALKELYEIQR